MLPSSRRNDVPKVVLTATSPLADEALACYPYEFRAGKSSSDKPRSLFDITETQALTAFEELARLYGPQRAVDMVKVQPLALATNPDNFGPTLEVLPV